MGVENSALRHRAAGFLGGSMLVTFEAHRSTTCTEYISSFLVFTAQCTIHLVRTGGRNAGKIRRVAEGGKNGIYSFATKSS